MVLPLSVHSIVLEHSYHVLSTDERVVDCNELDILTLQSNPSDQSSDPSKSVDSNLDLPHGGGLKLLER
nr:eukaryotic translation initiation factor 4 gamma 2 [Ipomoea batatas]GMD23238.1 eukaryotic translation initiation factor 4 gamma 2 [Ipomoea batatas]